jgi:hypothetical protein
MPLADLQKFVRRPEDIAEVLDGGKFGNGVGNGDAWRYRPRGLAYVRGRDGYQKVADSLHIRELMDNPDLLLIPELNALSFFYFYFKADSVPALAGAVSRDDWQAALAIVQHDAQRHYDDRDSAEIIDKTGTFRTCVAKAREMEAAREAAQ